MNTVEARAAFVNSQTACALIEMEAMKAENEMRWVRGESPAYGHEQFLAIIDRYGLGHNTVVAYLRDI